MKISDILSSGRVNISCELFPPKPGAGLANAAEIAARTAALKPSYISVTCGAAGGNRGQTVSIASDIQNSNGTTALAHLTCAAATKATVADTLSKLKREGINNILALRGDPPADYEGAVWTDFRYASELTEQIMRTGDFCVGGACYPEGHPESQGVESDIENLKHKLDAGCSFLVTQMFFDNNVLYNFLFRLMRAGIDIPVSAGIMPVTNGKQMKRILSLSGSSVPPKFKAIIERFGDDPESMEQAGIVYACDQIIDLLANGVNNIHIYTMNRPATAKKIFDNFSHIRKAGE